MSPWFIGALAIAAAMIGLALWAGPPKARKTASASSSARMPVQQPMKPVVLPPRPAKVEKVSAIKPVTGGAAKPLTELSPKATKPDAIAASLQQKHELGRRRMQHQEELNRAGVVIGDLEAAIARKEELEKNQAELVAMRERAAALRRSLAIIREAEKALV